MVLYIGLTTGDDLCSAPDTDLSMYSQLVIDVLIAEAMTLVAHFATSSGQRISLSRVPERSFLSLVNALKRQGVGRPVIADMLGLPLRSYHARLQRMTKTETARQRTLWKTMLDFLAAHPGTTKADILQRFRREDSLIVSSLLNDLVGSGVAYCTGSGTQMQFGLIRKDNFDLEQCAGDAIVWATIFRLGPFTFAELCDACAPLERELMEGILTRLVQQGRVQKLSRKSEEVYQSLDCTLPWGGEGWTAAFVDHFRAVSMALAAKLSRGQQSATRDDQVGGSTFYFDLDLEHPRRDEVLTLLSRLRNELSVLRREVEAENTTRQVAGDTRLRVTFYMGQSVEHSPSTALDGAATTLAGPEKGDS